MNKHKTFNLFRKKGGRAPAFQQKVKLLLFNFDNEIKFSYTTRILKLSVYRILK